MATASRTLDATQSGRFRVNEGVQYGVLIDGVSQNLNTTEVRLYLTNGSSTAHMVGATTGEKAGEKFVVNADFSGIEPGIYQAEVITKDGQVIYPQRGERTTVEIAHIDAN